jgi:mRNA-degrading endonuclease RelE of RelBE toxin-antitoxin system
MGYILKYTKSCKVSIIKSCKKNPVLRKAIDSKIREVLDDPMRFKPLRNILKGYRRIHILKSFVLKFTVDEENMIITLISFTHHDRAY